MEDTEGQESRRNQGRILSTRIASLLSQIGTDSSVFERNTRRVYVDKYDGESIPGLNAPIYKIDYDDFSVDQWQQTVTNKRYGRLPRLFIALDNNLYSVVNQHFIDTEGQTKKLEGINRAINEGNLEEQIENVTDSDPDSIPRLNFIPEVYDREFVDFDSEDYELVGSWLDGIESGEFSRLRP